MHDLYINFAIIKKLFVGDFLKTEEKSMNLMFNYCGNLEILPYVPFWTSGLYTYSLQMQNTEY